MTIVSTTALSQSAADARYELAPSVQMATPASGGTVQMRDDASNGALIISAAATISALTVNFPSDANSVIGQIRRIVALQNITTLTLGGATVLNAAGSMLVNDDIAYQKVAPNKWTRLQ